MFKVNYYNWMAYGINPASDYRDLIIATNDSRVLVQEANRLLACMDEDVERPEVIDEGWVFDDAVIIDVNYYDEYGRRQTGNVYIWLEEIKYPKGGEDLEF